MESKEHKRKKSHVVIVTSDAVDANVKQFRIRPWMLWSVIVVFCVLIGAGIGYIMYEDRIWEVANAKIEEHELNVKELEDKLVKQQELAAEEVKELKAQIEKLEGENEILLDTVSLQEKEAQETAEQIGKLYQPTMLPLTGGATIEENQEGEPKCIFNAAEGALIIATASGTVTAVSEEPEAGYKVTIDHENGYVTTYCNEAEPKVKQGDSVMQESTLFVIGEGNLKLIYQVMKDGVYVNPMDVMEIDG